MDCNFIVVALLAGAAAAAGAAATEFNVPGLVSCTPEASAVQSAGVIMPRRQPKPDGHRFDAHFKIQMVDAELAPVLCRGANQGVIRGIMEVQMHTL